MSFLYPIFLVGSLFVVVPIIYHMVRRSPRDRVPFSAVQFLDPSPPRLTRKSRLEHLWLLLLRCLILLLLAFAFARPYLDRVLEADRGEVDRQRHLILLDTSASMQRTGAWATALETLDELLERIDPAALGAVYTFDSRLSPLVTFEQWQNQTPAERLGQLRGRAAQREPEHRLTHLGNALLKAVELLEESSRLDDSENADQDWRIQVISDLQAGMLLDGIQGFEWPKGCSVTFHEVAVEGDTNVGLNVLPASQVTADRQEPLPRVRVKNSPASQAETFQFGWAGEAGAISDEEMLYLPPGKGRIMDAPARSETTTNDRLRVTGDDHDFDNEVWLAPLRARESLVVYIGSDSEADPDGPLFYLTRAFQQTSRHAVRVQAHPSDRLLPPAELEHLRLIVVGEAMGAELTEQVGQLNASGTVVLVVLHRQDLEPVLRSLAADESLTVSPGDIQRFALLGEIDFQHPLFVSFADPRYSDFSKIRFWRYERLAWDNPESGKAVARFDNGDPAFVQFNRGSGALFVAAFGWQRRLSSFALSTKFVPWLYHLLDFGVVEGVVRSHYLIEQPVDLSSLAKPVSIRTPAGDLVATEADVFYGATRPGIYEISSEPDPVRFAVNLHPAESDTAPLGEETLTGLGVPTEADRTAGPVSETAREFQRKLEAAEKESSQKYWRWAVLAALIIATLETGCSGLITRRLRQAPA